MLINQTSARSILRVLAIGIAISLMVPSAAQATTSVDHVNQISNTIPAWGPSDVAVNSSTNILYVTHWPSDEKKVSVVDGTTGLITSTIPVAADAVAVNAATNTIYLAHANDNSVSVVDGATNEVTRVVALQSQAAKGVHSIAVNETTNTIYVTNDDEYSGYDPASNALSVIDGATGSLVSTLPLQFPGALAVNETTNVVYITSANVQSLTVYDGQAGTVTSTVGLDHVVPLSVAVNESTDTVYLAGFLTNSVLVVNGTSGQVTATITVGQDPSAVAVDPITNTLYVANSRDNTVSVIDGASGLVLGTVAVPDQPRKLAVNPVTNNVYVTHPSGHDGITVLSEPAAPSIITTDLPDGNAGWLYQNSVTATGAARPTFTVSAGSLPPGLELLPESGLIYGTPSSAGQSTFTITATNETGSDSRSFTISIGPPVEYPYLTTQSLSEAVLQTPYSSTLIAEGNPAPTFEVTSGKLPDGLVLNPITGEISGVPTTLGDFTFGIQVENLGGTGYAEVQLSVLSAFTEAPEPTITGAAKVGNVLVANSGTWGPAPVNLTYQWTRGGVQIVGATSSSYALTPADLASAMSVAVTGVKPGYFLESKSSAATAPVTAGSLNSAIPTITGLVKVGEVVNAETGTWSPDGASFNYAWLADGAPIPGATSPSYQLAAADLGKRISVKITGTLAGYNTMSEVSETTGAVANGTIKTSRLAGSDRYETAVKISQKWPSATRVYIANGLDYPDALSAGPAAAHFNAPLLLTDPASIPDVVITELKRLKPNEIVIVGGTGVVNSAVEFALKSLPFNPKVHRVSGANRYETSRALATDTWGSGSLGAAYLATGTDFPDALSAGPAGANFDGPVVLVQGAAKSIDPSTHQLLTKLGVDRVELAGGNEVISLGIETQAKRIFGAANVIRNGGADRYATSVKINANQFTSASTVYLAQGLGFPDALAGAALAGVNGAPLFLSQSTCIPAVTMDAIEALGATNVVLLGGTEVLSDRVAKLTRCS